MTIPIWIAFIITAVCAIVAFCLGCAWRAICEDGAFADSVYEARFRQTNFYAPVPEIMPELEPKTLPIARARQAADRRRNA
jgi:hypothetical protein